MTVSTKAENYARYERGLYGNRLRTWGSVTECLASGHAGTVTARYAGRGGGGWCAYDVRPADLPALAACWQAEGADPKLIRLNESAPDDCLTLQGEAQRSAVGLELFYSTAREKMRAALRHGRSAVGLTALLLLQGHLAAASLDDVEALLCLYPGAVVEFSAYSRLLGDCRGRNTVVWEVRHY